MIPVVVHGAEGRMGRLVTALVDGADDYRLAALVTEPGRDRPAGAFHPQLPLVGQDRLATVVPDGGVVVDFSLASALPGLLAGLRTRPVALVTGTTGHTDAQLRQLREHALSACVVHAANFSVGIPALQMVLRLLARTLPSGFHAEQVETHHRGKQDRPSGTALLLAEVWQQERGGEPPPIHSQRIGGIVGEHCWTIGDEDETLVVSHRAGSRKAFLRGILPAVRFASGARPGYYSLQDVLMDQGSGGE
jgi:4-hydroxy-tetrahydrodipicolinate reductase